MGYDPSNAELASCLCAKHHAKFCRVVPAWGAASTGDRAPSAR